MQPSKPTKTQLAEALGISRQEVHRYAKKGMPCESIEAARAWRMESVRVRISEPRAPAPATLIRLVHELQDAGAALLAEGRRAAFDAMAPTLRQALRRVPARHRSRVLLAMPVIDALTEEMQRTLEEFEEPHGPLSDEEAQTMGEFWYATAAGEVVVTTPTY